MNWLDRIHVGDCRDLMRRMRDDGVRVNCVVTSPPYYALRDYQVAGQIGLESSLYEWVDTMVEVFECVWDILAEDGTLWLNLGDSYAQNGGAGWQGKNGQRADRRFTATRNTVAMREANRRPPQGLKAKDLMGQPWRVAFALQEAGWYLRSDIIWEKPTAMPESIKDRPTKAHEYLFLMARQETYYYDADAIAEPRSSTGGRKVSGHAHGPASHDPISHARDKGDAKTFRGGKYTNGKVDTAREIHGNKAAERATRNARSVWRIRSEPFTGAHFATFPRELVRRCILAGSRPGDVIFDPFMGTGTTAEVALSLGRRFIGTELNREYAEMFKTHRSQQAGLALDSAPLSGVSSHPFTDHP